MKAKGRQETAASSSFLHLPGAGIRGVFPCAQFVGNWSLSLINQATFPGPTAVLILSEQLGSRVNTERFELSLAALDCLNKLF